MQLLREYEQICDIYCLMIYLCRTKRHLFTTILLCSTLSMVRALQWKKCLSGVTGYWTELPISRLGNVTSGSTLFTESHGQDESGEMRDEASHGSPCQRVTQDNG